MIPDDRNLVSLARFFTPTEAYILQGRLEAEGVPAFVADANLAQTNALLNIALGGVRLLVPSDYLEHAREILAALDRGEYQLDDDADVNS